MNETKFVRRGASIVDLATNKEHTFNSINEAKRKSRFIQMKEDGMLGLGTLRVAEVKRKAKKRKINVKARKK